MIEVLDLILFIMRPLYVVRAWCPFLRCTVLVMVLSVLMPIGLSWAEESFMLNLKGAELTTLIETVAKVTGKNFVMDPGIKGKVTVVSAHPLSPNELYQVFLSILDVHGYIAVESSGVIKIVPSTEMKFQGEQMDSQQGDFSLGEEVVFQVFELENVDAGRLVAVLRPMVSPKGHLAAYPPSNMLIVSDYAQGVRRLAQILKRVDQPTSGEIEVINLQHASAADLVRVLEALNKANVATNAKASGEQQPVLVADDRTNSILVSGDKGFRIEMRAIISHLDTPVSATTGDTEVIYLRFANAKDLAPILNNVGQDFIKQVTKSVSSSKSATAKAPTPTGQTPEVRDASGMPVGPINVQAFEGANAVVITGPPLFHETLRGVIRQLDIRRAQVQVEAIIAEISTGMNSELGIQWGILAGPGKNQGIVSGTNFSGSISGGLFALGGQIAADTVPNYNPSGLSVGFTDAAHIALLLNALKRDTHTNILSTPSVVTMDNAEAAIVIGQEVPFITTNSTNNTGNPFQTITREKIGLSLKVTPQISEGDTIRMAIEFEDSALTPPPSSVNPSDVVTNTRSIKTEVLVEDGRVLVLGGLIKDDLLKTADKVPFLGELPILGNLFRYDTNKKTKTNLLVFLRPSILRSESDGLHLTQSKYDYIRAQQKAFPLQDGLLKLDRAPLLPDLKSYMKPPIATTPLSEKKEDLQEEVSLVVEKRKPEKSDSLESVPVVKEPSVVPPVVSPVVSPPVTVPTAQPAVVQEAPTSLDWSGRPGSLDRPYTDYSDQ
ncbi:MAG: type II secretion system secretin GspD [Magnetococcus sp. DMHC-6]